MADAPIDELITIEAERLHAVAALVNRFVVDKIKRDPTNIHIDPATGALLNTLSEAAKAAKYVIEQKIILMGGEGPEGGG